MPTDSTSNRALAIAGIVTVSAALITVNALSAAVKKADANEIVNVEQSGFIREISKGQVEGKLATEKLTDAVIKLTLEIAKLPNKKP
jgi:Zn-dependent M32 family carboxypeptidase